MAFEKLSDYYGSQSILPTFSRFNDVAALQRHEQHRHDLFTRKLNVPVRLFHNARLIEFGPDTGENSLVFAGWGADCTLVEPNIKAHPAIQQYFQTFGLGDRLSRLDSHDILDFSQTRNPNEKFDFIDAEGFLFTVKPEQAWIDLFAKMLNPGGLVVLFDYEAYSTFFEFLLKVIHSHLRRVMGLNAVDSARALFSAKWDSIPHRRPMEAWVMDVLENPFVRLRYLLDASQLARKMAASGLDLYSSWPPYKDALDVYWFKKTQATEDQLQHMADFVTRSRLSHMFGRKHFVAQLHSDLETTLRELLTLMDGLIDKVESEAIDRCLEIFRFIVQLIESPAVISDEEDLTLSLAAIRSVEEVLNIISTQDANRLIAFCNNDQAFIRTWGAPSHFAVYQLR